MTDRAWLRTTSTLGSLALALLALGCEKSPAAPATATTATGAQGGDVARFLPLEDATVFAFETTSTEAAGPGLLVLEVQRPRPDAARLVVAGHVQPVQIDAQGVQFGGGWLLKSPLALGAKFQGEFGVVELTALDRHVEVPAGKFDGCLETVESETRADASRRRTTIYCPHVGIVLRKTEFESDQGSGNQLMRLRSFGPRVNLVER